MHRRQIHLGRADIDHPRLPRAEKPRTQQIADPRCRRQRLLVVRLVVPGQEPDHHVVVAPSVPSRPGRSLAANIRRLARQSRAARPGPEVTVRILQRAQLADESFERVPQFRVMRHPIDLHGPRQILPGKLPRPRLERPQRLSIAIAKHLEHAGIGVRHDQQPLPRDGPQIVGHHAAQLKLCPRRPLQIGRAFENTVLTRGQWNA